MASPSTISTTTRVYNFYALTSEEQISLINTLGSDWSNASTPVLYVDDIGQSSNGVYPHGLMYATGDSQNPGKKLIILEHNISRFITDSSLAATWAKIILHEWLHSIRLNHVSDSSNIMYPTYQANQTLSTSVDEVNDYPNYYSKPASSGRNQKQELRTWDGYP